MSDYISREALLRMVGHRPTTPTTDREDRLISAFISTIETFPAADVRPNVRGRWENNHCSACGMMPMGDELWEDCDFDQPRFEWFMNYCPNCGAEMEAGE